MVKKKNKLIFILYVIVLKNLSHFFLVDVERMIHHTSNTELPALPPLNVASPSSRHQEKWLSEQEKLR